MADRSDEFRTGASSAAGTSDPAAIRAEIEDTRARMSDTLGELGERLNPQVVKDKVKDTIRDATIGRVEHMARKTKERLDDTSLTLMETIRENPVPAAIMAIGLGWLIVNGRRERSMSDRGVALARLNDDRESNDWYRGGSRRAAYGEGLDDYEQGEGMMGMDDDFDYAGDASYASSFADEAGGFRGRASDLAHDVRDRAGDMASRARDTASRVGSRARETAGRARERVRETAGRVGERARDVAQRTSERARDVAHRTSERARDVAHRTSEKSREYAHSVADASRRQAKRAEDMYYENPLGVGLAVVAAGFAVGLGAPRTEVETRLVGDARDRFVDRAKDMAREKKDQVQHVAERVVDEGKRVAKDALREEGLMGNRGQPQGQQPVM